MDYIQLLQKNLQSVNENLITKFLYAEYERLEPKIIKLQQEQISEHRGFDDNLLDRYSGENSIYKNITQEYADRKIPYPSLTKKTAGSSYNFVWSGDFMKNFRTRKQGGGIKIYSTGTGSKKKKEFFEDYKNMFGLDSENTATIESEVMYYVLVKSLERIYK